MATLKQRICTLEIKASPHIINKPEFMASYDIAKRYWEANGRTEV